MESQVKKQNSKKKTIINQKGKMKNKNKRILNIIIR
jgi:hypothetical protein